MYTCNTCNDCDLHVVIADFFTNQQLVLTIDFLYLSLVVSVSLSPPK